MKRIMIAMGAVMSLALGAWAVDSADSTVVSGGKVVSYMPFTGMPTGSLDPTLADNATDMVGSGVHWECANGASSTEDSVITNLTGDAGDNFLQIDQTETLYRLMNVTQAATTNAVSATEGIYFASKVQFTASDETNGVNLVSQGEGDKLLIWLRAADLDDDGDVDDVDGTNLVVTAAGSEGPGAAPVDYVITNVNVQPGTWYTLVVKSTLESNGSGLEFSIELGDDTQLTQLAAEGNVTNFYSLVNSGIAAKTITKVGFKGTGAVDDLEFGTIALEQEIFFKVGNTPCATFGEALAAAKSSGDVIKLLKDYAGGELNIANGDEIILDLAGHTISLSAEAQYAVIYNAGTLTITNSTAEVGCVNGGSGYYAVYNDGTLTIVGGKYYGMDGSTDPNNAAVIDASPDQTMKVYYISNGTATDSVLKQEESGADAGYWVIKEVALVHAVTFSQNGTHVEEYDTTVKDGESLAPAQIPAFTGGVWDVDPTTAVITCETNFNYKISGSNWPAAWSDDSAYADDYTDELTTWMEKYSISSMDDLEVADETAFLLNIDPKAADKTIDATAITIDGTTVKITVDQKLGSAYGVVYLMYGSTPALGSVKTITFVDGEGDTPSSMTTLEGETATAQFYKVGVGFAAPVTAEP